jgi:hypothetical protein
MSDFLGNVQDDRNILEKIAAKIPGFSGYMETIHRRESDKLLRETIADHFEELYKRISYLQEDFISQGEIMYVDDLEKAAIKLRTFIDKIRTASYGYSGFFDAVRVDEEDLARAYEYDLSLLNMEDDVAHAIDNVEASIGTDGLPAAIRNLNGLAAQCVEMFNRRSEVMKFE